MPQVDIDEEELRRLKTMESTLGSMLKHPKASRLLETAHKMVDEKAPTPRLDDDAQREALLAEDRKTIKELREQVEADRAERKQNETLSSLQRKRDEGLAVLRAKGWTDEGLKGVEKIMEDHGILDPAIAAAYFEKQHPPSEPVSPGGIGAWDFFDSPKEGEDDLKKLIETKGEGNLVDKMARDALRDIRGR